MVVAELVFLISLHECCLFLKIETTLFPWPEAETQHWLDNMCWNLKLNCTPFCDYIVLQNLLFSFSPLWWFSNSLQMWQEPFCESTSSRWRHRCCQGVPFFLACLKSVVRYTHHVSRSVGSVGSTLFSLLLFLIMFVGLSYFLNLVPNPVKSASTLFITYHLPSTVCFVLSSASFHLKDHFHSICFICLLRHSTLSVNLSSIKNWKTPTRWFMQACFHLHALLWGCCYLNHNHKWGVELKPQSLILVWSDLGTFSHAFSESFRRSLTNSRRAWTCAFFSSSVLIHYSVVCYHWCC